MGFVGWGRRCELVTQHAQVEQDCYEFPMLIHKDSLPSESLDADGSYYALNGGGDIRLSSDQAGDSQLPCEIEAFVTDNDPANGKAAIWTKRTLSSASNTSTWIWYHKSGESQPAEDNAYGKENVWDSNFVMVQHMNQIPDGTAGEIVDSTSNDNDGTTSGMDSADQVSGQIDGSLDFDGSNDYVDCSNTGMTDTNYFLSFWVNPYNVLSDRYVFDQTTDAIGRRSVLLGYQDGYFNYFDGAYPTGTAADTQIAATQDVWQHIVMGTDGTKVYGYKNGVKVVEEIGDWESTGATHFYIGRGYHLFNGIIDEVHISNIVRLAGWIATEYNSQYSPITFLIPETPETPVAYSEQFKDLLSEISAGIEELFDLSVEITAICAPFPRYVDLFTQMAVGVISFPSVRREFTVMKRTTDFTVVPRTTDFKVVPRTTDFTIVK